MCENQLFTTKKIRTSYDIMTHESAEQGLLLENGWIDEEGEDMHPDKWDKYNGTSAVDNAVEFLQNKGVIQASNSHFSGGEWYQSESEQDMYSGEYTTNYYHLVGFTHDEEECIFKLINKENKERIRIMETGKQFDYMAYIKKLETQIEALKKPVMIEVNKGIAECIFCPDGVTVEIIDNDGEGI